jgi:hypothetical protein
LNCERAAAKSPQFKAASELAVPSYGVMPPCSIGMVAHAGSESGSQHREAGMSREQLACRHAAGERVARDLAASRGGRISRRGALFGLACVAALLSGLVAAPAPAQQGDDGDWIGTWTAQPATRVGRGFFAPVGFPRALRNQTLPQIAHVSLGGDRVRVVISNEYGERPLVIGAAHVALACDGIAIVPGSDRARPSAAARPPRSRLARR